MSKRASKLKTSKSLGRTDSYRDLLGGIRALLDAAKRMSARAVNSVMALTYWEIGRRVVEFEQRGLVRAEYGAELLKRLSADLTLRFGRGYSIDNLESMRMVYLTFPADKISETASRKLELLPSKGSRSRTNSKSETLSRISETATLTSPIMAPPLPLSWSHYVHLVRRSRSSEALEFYHREALRGGWSVRQLDRQISSLFYERTALSKNKALMLRNGQIRKLDDAVSPDEEIRDPLVLEFLNLKDEYSEFDLEETLIKHLEAFLLELGSDFTFVGRQRRLRVGNQWFRVDLLLFHRRLRCLVVVDLKLGPLTHADVGQMNLYLNYAREHWTHAEENPPVGIILCTERDHAVAKYTLDGLPNQILAREYQLALPKEKLLENELAKTRRFIEAHQATVNVIDGQSKPRSPKRTKPRRSR